MALNKDAQKKLLKALRLTDEEIAALLDDDGEHDVAIGEDIHVLTNAELMVRDSGKYNEGKEVGVETAVKEYKKANNLEFKGKTMKDLEEYFTEHNEDAIAVKKLTEDVAALTRERDGAVTELAAVRLQARVRGWIPELNNGMTKAEALSVMQANGFEFKEVDGAVVAYRHGQVIKAADADAAAGADVVIKDFFEMEKKWMGDADANNTGKSGGGGNSSSVKSRPIYSRASEVEKAFNARYGAGASMGTEHDFAGHLQKIMKEAELAGTPLVMD